MKMTPAQTWRVEMGELHCEEDGAAKRKEKEGSESRDVGH